MLTLSQLLVLTEGERRRFTTKYTVDSFEQRTDSDNIGDFIQFVALLLGGKEPRKSAIRLYSEEVSADATTKVSCSCPYFRIRLAPVLYTMGATDLRVGRDEIPEEYQRLQKPGLCPHLLKLAEVILSPNSTETRRLRQQSPRVSINDRLRRLT